MRNLFSWRLIPSDAEFSSFWETATFVFDTNCLLDLYRVSRPTVEDFLKILEHLQDRIWLPYQVADEFLNRREQEIDREAASFQKALLALEKWTSEQKKFNSLRGQLGEAGRIVASELEYLFDKQTNYLDAVDELEMVFRDKINQLKNTHFPFDADNDIILERILSIFDAKVGEPYDEQTLQKLYKQGEDRYKKLQPPGFEDAKKKEDERKYGDFILWKQILDFAKKEARPIIIITSEKKEDWWIKKNGEIISPHIELRREFHEYVQQPFWMYRTQHFLEMAKEKFTVEINPRSIEETNVIADAELVDEEDDIDQVISKSIYSSSKKIIEQMKPPIPDLQSQRLIEQMKLSILDSQLQGLIEQIKQPIIPDSQIQGLIEQMKSQIIPDSQMQRLIEQIKQPIIPDSQMQRLIEQMKRLNND
ncbi:PIN-like domain-containing protein [Okeanomitos corallinicola TIOX110]|uniref:PIN-like domain-containing protein n=1 Tax=Okeanomitos corallinicola TIOX110 TaxID=3133117 RepID=A0ABZ2UU31_9CYAN